MWPFRKKPQPPRDLRFDNEGWQVGDIAECVIDGWHLYWPGSPRKGERRRVREVKEGTIAQGPQSGALAVGLGFHGHPHHHLWICMGFRKVRDGQYEASTEAEEGIQPGYDFRREIGIPAKEMMIVRIERKIDEARP